MAEEKVGIPNLARPGRPVRLDSARARAAHAALLGALTAGRPGAIFAERKAAMIATGPAIFPGGEKAGW